MSPNAAAPDRVDATAHALGRLVMTERASDERYSSVNYGHHWKEYSAGDLRRYFALLSPDFVVEIDWYLTDLEGATGWRRSGRALLARVPCWRSAFLASAPQLPMQSAAAECAPMVMPCST